MKTHSLKTWPSFWFAVERGDKKFEVRRHDRDFAVGDMLLLRMWDPSAKSVGGYVRDTERQSHSGESLEEMARTIHARVTCVMTGGQFGIAEGWCVLGIQTMEVGRGGSNEVLRV